MLTEETPSIFLTTIRIYKCWYIFPHFSPSCMHRRPLPRVAVWAILHLFSLQLSGSIFKILISSFPHLSPLCMHHSPLPRVAVWAAACHPPQAILARPACPEYHFQSGFSCPLAFLISWEIFQVSGLKDESGWTIIQENLCRTFILSATMLHLECIADKIIPSYAIKTPRW